MRLAWLSLPISGYSIASSRCSLSEVDIKPSIQLTTSEQLPDRKPHQAAPLAPHHRPSGSKIEGVKRPAIEVTSRITPKGNVSQKKRMFSYSTQQQQQQSQSRIPQANTARHGNTPMKALASTSEMTKSGIPVKTEVKTTPLRNSTPYAPLAGGRSCPLTRSSSP